MIINPNIFLLPKPPTLIVWNYKSHEQFEIDKNHTIRLIELLENSSLFDQNNKIDIALLDAGIFLDTPFMPDILQWDVLSKIFHIGTKDLAPEAIPQTAMEWAQHYLSQCDDAMNRAPPLPHRLENQPLENMLCLPSPSFNKSLDENGSLKQSLLNRKTCRSFLSKSVCIDDVSTLLYLCLGYLSERDLDMNELAPMMFRSRRSSPSGGGLNSSEGYLYAQNVRGLDPGFYYYHPQQHSLKLLSRIKEPLGSLLQGQHFANNLPFGIFITSRLDKMWWKYRHSQAYRVSLLEAGHISQTIQLCATALGFNTWLTAALCERKIERALVLPDLVEQAFLFVGAGYSDGEANCKEINDLLKK